VETNTPFGKVGGREQLRNPEYMYLTQLEAQEKSRIYSEGLGIALLVDWSDLRCSRAFASGMSGQG